MDMETDGKKKFFNVIGYVFFGAGFLVWLVAGLWGLFICLRIISVELGFIGTIFAFMLFPATVAVAPWYIGLKFAYWFPVILIYGGGFAGTIFYGIGTFFID